MQLHRRGGGCARSRARALTFELCEKKPRLLSHTPHSLYYKVMENSCCGRCDGVRIKEFSRLYGDSKIRTLLSLVKVCSYQQQLQFVEALNEYLHKDFISHLPDNLVKKVLSFLSVKDGINCTMVSRKWNQVVGACVSFWNTKAKELGLSNPLVAELMKTSQFKCLKDVCVCALSQQTRIHSLIVHTAAVCKNPCGVSSIYAGCGITLRYSELNGSARVVIEHIISPHSLVEIAALSVQPFSGRIKWASSSEDYVMWKQLDGKWNGYDITSLEGELEQWVDEPVSQGFHSISFCQCCHLIAIVSEAEDDAEVWDLQVIKLNEGKATLRKMVYPLPLERVQNMWEKKRHFLGGEVNLLSDSEKDETGFCQSHRVFLQVDSKLVVYRLKAVPVSEKLLLIHQFLPDSQLSKPLHVFSPAILEQPFPLMDLQVSKGRPYFCYSSDYIRVALFYESYLYIWKLDDYGEESHVDLLLYNLPPDCKCVAVGSMYAVLASNSHGRCYVVLPRTGELLLQISSAERCFNHEAHHSACFDFFGPINQQWLSDFKCFDFWPVATVFDNSKRENELKVLVGTQNHSVWLARNRE